jgi:serine/threonine protein kinase
MFQLLRGLRYSHSYGIIHRGATGASGKGGGGWMRARTRPAVAVWSRADLKPANLLVTKNCDLVSRRPHRFQHGSRATSLPTPPPSPPPTLHHACGDGR